MLALGIALGGGLGALARYGLGLAVSRATAHTALAGLPMGTLLVNVLGSFALGLLLGLGASGGLPAPVRIAMATGFLGSLTTFSTVEADTAQFLFQGRVDWAGAYLLANVVLGFLAFLAGGALVRAGGGEAA